ncbi:hypothetical protein [Neolewinella persica]|uniref:hypothetical protein n=1 Tax=Neolewinella persica TaxID=70998 RepID=UPI0003666995|nr:hypothetical protein [Neolewinella persica]
MKYWINRTPKEHTFIVHADKKIYRLRAKPEEIIDIRQQLDKGRVNDKFMGVPESYLRYVEFQETEPVLSLHYGKETEDKILVSDLPLRREIFEYFRAHTGEHTYEAKRKTLFARIRKPGIALLVLLIFGGGVAFFIREAMQGNYYTVEGSNPGIMGLFIGLAELGVVFNALIFLPLTGLCLYLMMRASEKNGVVERILYKRY